MNLAILTINFHRQKLHLQVIMLNIQPTSRWGEVAYLTCIGYAEVNKMISQPLQLSPASLN